MKRVLLVFGLVAPLMVGAQAQTTVAGKSEAKLKLADETLSFPGTGTPNNNAGRASLWSSDFSDATDWTLGGQLGMQGTWEIGSAPTTFTNYIGTPTGLTAPYAFFNCIQYMITTPPTLQAQNAWIQIADTIDVSAVSHIRVSYKQLYRAFNSDQVIVEIADVTAPTTWISNEVNTDVPTNISTNNIAGGVNGYTHFNVTGMNNIVVRFRWAAEAGQFGGGYGWILDDVDVSEAPTNDVRLAAPFIGLYTKYPLGQENRDVELGVDVINDGSAAQTLELSAFSASQIGTVAAQSYPAFTRDSIAFTSVFNPAAGAGVKTVTFKGAYSPGPDTVVSVSKSFEVTANTFSKDKNQYIRGFDYGGVTVSGQPILNVISGFQVSQDATATSVSVMLGEETTAGASFQVNLYRSAGASLELVSESDIITVTAAQINTATSNNPKIVKVNFLEGSVALEAGEYWVAVSNQGGTIGVAYDPFEPIRDFPNDGGTSVLFTTTSGIDNLIRLGNGNTPAIRLNLNEAGAGIKENNMNGSVNVFPNPANDVVNINLKDFSGMTQVKMFNMNGQEVLSERVNVASASFVKTIDVSGFAAGIYTVNITSESGVASVKVSVK